MVGGVKFEMSFLNPYSTQGAKIFAYQKKSTHHSVTLIAGVTSKYFSNKNIHIKVTHTSTEQLV